MKVTKRMMNKHELIDNIMKKTGFSRINTIKFYNAYIETVKESLAKKVGIRSVGFGSFIVRHRRARKGRNPQTGKPIKIPACNTPAFKAGTGLKKAVK